MRLSIYMMNKTDKDITAIKSFQRTDTDYKIERKYLDKSNIKGYRKGILFYTKTEQDQKWLEQISPLMRVPIEPNVNTIYRGVIVLQINRRYMALSFNSGINLLKSEYIDYDFGFNIANKLLEKNKVRGYNSMDVGPTIINIGKNSVKSIPTSTINNPRSLMTLDALSGRTKENTNVSGKYGLKIEFEGDLRRDLIKFLTNISNAYIDKDFEGGPEVKSNLSKINDKDKVEMLDSKLIDQIKELIEFSEKNIKITESMLNNIKFNINIPTEIQHEGFNYTGIGYPRSRKEKDLNTKDYFEQLALFLNKTNNKIKSRDIIKKIKRDKIYILERGKEIEDLNYKTVYNSLIVEYSLDKEYKAMLIERQWYYVDRDYYARLSSLLNDNRDFSELEFINFIPLSESHRDMDHKNKIISEGLYNEDLAKRNGLYLFDKDNYSFSEEIGSRNFIASSKMEACDILSYNEEEEKVFLIHIKRDSGPSGISHLSTQARISADMISDVNEKPEFIKFINSKHDNLDIPLDIERSNVNIVLGIITKRHNKDDLKEVFTILEMKAISDVILDIKEKGMNCIIKLIPKEV